MAEHGERRRAGWLWLDTIVGASAIVISLASLWVAVREGDTQERILSASVWPFLQFSTADVSPTGATQIDFHLQNAGVGPARVVWITLYRNGTPYQTARDAIRACCGEIRGPAMITAGLQDRVLTAGQDVIFIHLALREGDREIWHRLDYARQHFYVRSCYCSVLDDCWLLDSRSKNASAVGRCPPPEPPVYEG